MRRTLLRTALLLSGVVCGAPAVAVNVLGDNVQLSCEQPTILSLECDYRLLEPEPVSRASATIGDLELPATLLPAPDPPGPSALLFLIDASSASDAATLHRYRSDILALIQSAGTHHRFGLAMFDTDLRIAAPLGASREQLTAALATLDKNPEEAPTELFRHTLGAIRLIADYSAHRRAILLFADGTADDQAYDHHDVIDAARTSGVTLYGMGPDSSGTASVMVQTLRRLGEDTGGRFYPRGPDGGLSPQVLENPLRLQDNGGRIRIDLSAAIGESNGDVNIALATGEGSARASVPVLPPPPAAAGPADPSAAKPVAAPAPKPATPVGVNRPMTSEDTSQWWFLAAIAALLVALATTGWVMNRAQSARALRLQRADQPVAYLELQDSEHARHAITADTFRIGRHDTNDLTLSDPSLSREHAEIHWQPNGAFSIVDLNSMNGVHVNGQRIKSAKISEGDIIELGDVELRFTSYAEDSLSGEGPDTNHGVTLETILANKRRAE